MFAVFRAAKKVGGVKRRPNNEELEGWTKSFCEVR